METELFERIRTCDVGEPFAAADRSRGDALLSVIAGERASQGPGNKIVACRGRTHIAWQGLVRPEVLRTGTHARS